MSMADEKQETAAIADKAARCHVAGRSMHRLQDIRLQTVR